jgi:methionyl aminopeptidase
MIVCKSPAELEKMHQAGLIVWGVSNDLRAMVKPGISTKELDEFAERIHGGKVAHPAFKNYRGYPAFALHVDQPGSRARDSLLVAALREGDILSLDFGVELDGYFGDAAVTVPVGEDSPELEKLLRVTRESLDRPSSR